MGIDWDNFKPTYEPSELALGLIRDVATTFLTSGEGTPDQEKRISLGKDWRIPNDLANSGILRNVSNNYYPTVLALYYLDEDLRSRYEEAVEVVLLALKRLFVMTKRGGRFTLHDIRMSFAALNVTARPLADIVLVGASFLRDFPNYFGNFEGSGDQPVSAAWVNENILDFESLGQSWEEEWNRRYPVQKAGPVAAQKDETAAASMVDADPLSLLEVRDFTFVQDATLRKIVERDYGELQNIRQGIKSRMILAGGLIEALLLDAVLADEERARKLDSASPKALNEWNLATLIDVSVDLGLISEGPKQHGHAVRDFRNLVHPGKEMRGDYVVGQHEAHAAEVTLRMVIRDLLDRKKKKAS